MKIITWYHITTIGIGIMCIGGVFAGKMLELAANTTDIVGVGLFFFLSTFTISIGLSVSRGGWDARNYQTQGR
jgi:hypothetical protein